MAMEFDEHLPKDKRHQLKLSSKGMVKKTISKSNPKRVWVNLGHISFDVLFWYSESN